MPIPAAFYGPAGPRASDSCARSSRVALALLCALAVLAPAAAPAAADDAGPSTRLQTVLGRALRAVGPASGAYVLDLDTGQELYARRADAPRIPASVEKLYTTATALTLLGPEAVLATTVAGDGVLGTDGVYGGNLFLEGGGDPTFGTSSFARRAYGTGATVEALAGQLAQAGVARVRGRVRGDESLFDGRRGVPSSGFGFSADVEPLTALSFNRGRLGPRGPATLAARALVAALRRLGVRVTGGAGAGTAPPGAAELASVASPDLATLARLTNVPSDNFLAEMLLKGLGARFGAAGSTPGGAAVVRATLARFGIHPRVVDGSGLARANRTTPREVVGLLRAMRSGPVADAFAASLPVAGREGTLARRMRRTAAQDACRAKTGTLRAVSALAGYCTARDGHTLAFAFLMNRVSPVAARRRQDRMAAALARLDSGAPPATAPGIDGGAFAAAVNRR